MDRDQYEAFIDALLAADKTEFKDWEKDTPYFEGCLPIEVMAERGRETLRFGPLKPVGLTNPHAPDAKPHAVVQLRRDNALGTLYNLVGFQTKMKHGAQTEVFRTHPRPRERRASPASAASTATPSSTPPACSTPRCACAPTPASASPARSPASRATSRAPPWASSPAASPPPSASASPSPRPRHHRHGRAPRATSPAAPRPQTFQPMNVNFGLFPPLADARAGRRGRRDRYRAYTDRAKADFTAWLTPAPVPA